MLMVQRFLDLESPGGSAEHGVNDQGCLLSSCLAALFCLTPLSDRSRLRSSQLRSPRHPHLSAQGRIEVDSAGKHNLNTRAQAVPTQLLRGSER